MDENVAPKRPRTTRWLSRLMFVIGVIAAFMVFWRFNYPVYSWNQKTTITISTPQGLVTGSAVVSVTWGDRPRIVTDAPHVYHDFTGEAVVVELPGKRYLFALVKNAGYEPLRVFGQEKLPKQTPYATDSLLPAAHEVTNHSGETRTLTPEQYPMLVTFGDIHDPASVSRVDPQNLAASFGPGYALDAITMTITNEPVTEGKMEGVLGWLEAVGRKQANLKGKPLTGLVSDQPDPQIYMIEPSDFSTELYK